MATFRILNCMVLLCFVLGVNSQSPTTADFITEDGYAVTTYDNVITEDNYILTMFAIAPAAHCTAAKNPVLMWHNHVSCSDIFVLNGGDSLPYLLAEDCHPVYLGNSRSTQYCQRHLNLTTSDPIFWDYSYYEIGYYDMAACIDYIQNINGATVPVDIISYSQGSTSCMALLADRPTYRSKSRHHVLLNPWTHMQKTALPAMVVAGLSLGCKPQTTYLMNWLTNPQVTSAMARTLCDPHAATCDLFRVIYGSVHNAQLNQTAYERIFINHPVASSAKELQHISQGICNANFDFKHFNYGPNQNMLKYGSAVPPSYDFTGIANDFLIFQGDIDLCAMPGDVQSFLFDLPASITKTVVMVPGFDHLNVVIDQDVKTKVNLPVVNFLN